MKKNIAVVLIIMLLFSSFSYAGNSEKRKGNNEFSCTLTEKHYDMLETMNHESMSKGEVFNILFEKKFQRVTPELKEILYDTPFILNGDDVPDLDKDDSVFSIASADEFYSTYKISNGIISFMSVTQKNEDWHLLYAETELLNSSNVFQGGSYNIVSDYNYCATAAQASPATGNYYVRGRHTVWQYESSGASSTTSYTNGFSFVEFK